MRCSIPAPELERLLALTAGSPDREICGLLFGTDDRIIAAAPADNIAADPARAFEIDPAALFAALRAERAGGPRVIGCYHSHPNGSTAPSARDVAMAQPGTLWLIVACGKARLWRAAGGGFDAVALTVDMKRCAGRP